MRFALLVILATFATAGCKGDRDKCEKAARNYAELMLRDRLWKKANEEIAALPKDQQELARSKKLSEFTNELEGNIDFFTEQCMSANNDEQVACMIDAKTAEAVAKCAEPAGK